MAKKNKPKKINLEDLGGFVFSTNPDFDYEQNNEVESIRPSDQLLGLHFEKKGRGGKQVVIIRGFEGPHPPESRHSESLLVLRGV